MTNIALCSCNLLQIYQRNIARIGVKTINQRDIGTIFVISRRHIVLARLRYNDISQSKTINRHNMGSWGGAVVRALASHQCVPGSIFGPGVMCGLSLLLVLVPAPRVFLRVLRFSSLLKKSTFLNSNSIGNSRATGLSVEDCYVLPSLNKVNLILIYRCSEVRCNNKS